jgi:hypothetical protein
VAGRERARRLLAEINAPPQPDVAYSETLEKRDAALRKLFGKVEGGVYIEPPLFVDYGCNVSAGSFYANFGYALLPIIFPGTSICRVKVNRSMVV